MSTTQAKTHGNVVVGGESRAISQGIKLATRNASDTSIYTLAHQLISLQGDRSVRPDGHISGGSASSNGTNDEVDVTASAVYIGGARVTSSAVSGLSIARPSVDTHIKYAICVNSSGVVSAEAGSEGTSFSDTRGAAGGYPLVPAGMTQICGVQYSSQTPALVLAAEIDETPIGEDGLGGRILYDYPNFELVLHPDFDAGIDYAHVKYSFAPATLYADADGARCYVTYSTPSFSEIGLTNDLVLPEETVSGNSTTVYRKVLKSVSRDQNDFTLTIMGDDIVNDMAPFRGKDVWFKAVFDPLIPTKYALFAASVGVATSIPSDDNTTYSLTGVPQTDLLLVDENA